MPDSIERELEVVRKPLGPPGALPELLAGVTIVASLVAIGDLLPALFGLPGILATQALVILLPTAIYVAASETSVARALALKKPSPRDVVAAMVVAVGMYLLSTALVSWQQLVAPIAAAEQDGFRQLEGEVSSFPGLAFLALVVAPAICEETLFRGLILTRLRRRVGDVAASVVCGVLFGLFHRSMHRLVAQSLLGLMAAITVVRCGSIWPSVILHGTYNLLVLVFGSALFEAESRAGLASTGLTLAILGQVLVRRRSEFT